MPNISTYESKKAILLDLLPWMHKHNPSLFMHPRKDFPVYASREGLCLCIQGRGSSRKRPECPNRQVLSCRLINHTREYDLLAEYMRRFHENINRVWVKTSEYGGKITQIFKRVYSFNRDLRVVWFHHCKDILSLKMWLCSESCNMKGTWQARSLSAGQWATVACIKTGDLPTFKK